MIAFGSPSAISRPKSMTDQPVDHGQQGVDHVFDPDDRHIRWRPESSVIVSTSETHSRFRQIRPRFRPASASFGFAQSARGQLQPFAVEQRQRLPAGYIGLVEQEGRSVPARPGNAVPRHVPRIPAPCVAAHSGRFRTHVMPRRMAAAPESCAPCRRGSADSCAVAGHVFVPGTGWSRHPAPAFP